MTLTLKQQRAEVRKLNADRKRLQGKTPPKPPGRLTVSEVARRLLERQQRQLSHVTLKDDNAKRETHIEVAIYAGDFEGITFPGQLRDVCVGIYDELRKRYPMQVEATLETQLRASVAELKRKPKKAR